MMIGILKKYAAIKFLQNTIPLFKVQSWLYGFYIIESNAWYICYLEDATHVVQATHPIHIAH